MSGGQRRAPIAQPTSERTADQSTPSASGLTAERPGMNRERDPSEEGDRDVVTRVYRGQARTPRRYDRPDT